MANTTADLMEGFNLQYCTRYTCVSNKGRGDFLVDNLIPKKCVAQCLQFLKVKLKCQRDKRLLRWICQKNRLLERAFTFPT